MDQARLLKGTNDPHQWATHNGDFNEQRFSPLTAINDGNVKQLGLAWYGDYDTNQIQHGSPLYVDGVIYVSTSRNWVHAFDARNGRRLWTYTPQQLVPNNNLGNANKGIAAWNGKIYQGLVDSRLVAIDARNGRQVWETNIAPASLVGSNTRAYSISMPPRVAKGKVFVGASGAEYGARGFIAAYDAETGKELWRFWTVPGDPAIAEPNQPHLVEARKTWPTNRKYWEQGGGGTIWDSLVFDPVTDLLYFGTGNGTPWNREMRDSQSGDNLYAASIVAIRPDTGEYVWHYQETPGDSWDFDATTPITVADLTFDGVKKHVLVKPSKNGFLYVIEAANGKLISADAFVPSVTWASGIDMKTGRPIEVPGSRYETEPFNVGPSPAGGRSWHPHAFSPITGLIYIPSRENYGETQPQTLPASGVPPLLTRYAAPAPENRTLKPHNKAADTGYLQAWDPVARRMVWQTPPESPRRHGGATVTAGNLVFMGNATGKMIRAYNARTGEKLWEFDAQTDVHPAPITYELDGVQYIAASVGGPAAGDYFAPGYGRMLVFRLGGTAKLPPNAPYTPRPLNPPPATAPADVVARGAQLFEENCAVCHGSNATQLRNGSAPILTTTPLLHAQLGFDQVVLQGGRLERGMPSFSDKLNAADSAAVLAYIVARANEVKSQQAAPAGGRGAAGAAPTGARAAGGN